MSNPLRDIEALGQSIWQDNISRQLLDEGTLRRLIEDDGISGVTSNPTIFEKAMGHSDRYDDAFREQLGETSDVEEIFNQLAYKDIRDAADLLRPTWDRTNGADGHVSFEVCGIAGVRCRQDDRSSQASSRGDRSPQRADQGAGH